MKKLLVSLMVGALMAGMAAPAADAKSRKKTRLTVHPARVHPAVPATGLVVGTGATVGYFALNDWKWRGWNHKNAHGITTGGTYLLTSVACAAITPMVATVVVGRPLTAKEANISLVGCFVPIIGPLVLSAIYDAHPEW